MKLRSKFIILILVFLLYGFVYKSETAFAQCSWTQCDSATCCDWGGVPCLDCDKEGNCWWTTCQGCTPYDCGSCYTVYNNGAACSTGSGPGVCSWGSCVPTCTYAANPCNCNQCRECGFINPCTGYCSIGSPPPTKYSAESCGCGGRKNVCNGQCEGERALSVSKPIPPGDGTTACCSSASDCVYQSACYSTGTKVCAGTSATMCNNGNIVQGARLCDGNQLVYCNNVGQIQQTSAMCDGNTAVSCSNGQVTQTTCQYGCNSGECIPGSMTNYRLSKAGLQINDLQLLTQNPTVGQYLEFSWNEQTPWPSNWYREGEIIRVSNNERVIHNLQVGASPQTVATTGAPSGDYIAKIRAYNSAGYSPWAEIRFTLNPPLPQVTDNSIHITVNNREVTQNNPVRIGDAMNIRWDDPTGITIQ